jgi:ferredoxin
MCEEEEDMLDLAFDVTDTSRLGCQVKVTEAFEGIKVRSKQRPGIPAK